MHSWRNMGMWIEFSDEFNPHPVYYGRLLHENRFRWASIKIHDGTNVIHQDPAWIQACKDQGIAVGGWGVLQTDPVDEAKLAHELLGRYMLQSYIADAEAPHKSDEGGDPRRSKQFCESFDAAFNHPSSRFMLGIPRMFSTYGAASGLNEMGNTKKSEGYVMDFASWFKYGWRFGPQVYPHQYGEVYSLANCLSHAKRCGWPMGLVKPVIENYNGVHAEQNKDALKEAYSLNSRTLKGISIFYANHCREEDIQAYGRYCKNWYLADS